jgi:hypothetical protein
MSTLNQHETLLHFDKQQQQVKEEIVSPSKRKIIIEQLLENDNRYKLFGRFNAKKSAKVAYSIGFVFLMMAISSRVLIAILRHDQIDEVISRW